MQQTISTIKDIITIISLCIASYVAIKGLDTWREQLKGATDYELAKGIMQATYRLRKAIEEFRRGIIFPGESVYAMKQAGVDSSPKDKDYDAKSFAAVYHVRWASVADAYKALEMELLEAEALWGKDVVNAVKSIRENVNSLYAAIDLILKDNYPIGRRILNDETRINLEKVIYSWFDEPENEGFIHDLNSLIKGIEDVARPYLAH